jgi:hypothetical protein
VLTDARRQVHDIGEFGHQRVQVGAVDSVGAAQQERGCAAGVVGVGVAFR